MARFDRRALAGIRRLLRAPPKRDGAFGRLVRAAELLTSPQLSRLKKCAGCPWLFLDQSKNMSRRAAGHNLILSVRILPFCPD